MFLFIGIAVHILLALGLRLAFGWRWGVMIAIFAAKELGEQKYRLPGSVTTLEKNLAMLAALFTDPAVLAQWTLPALAVWLYDRAISHKRP